MANRKNNNTVAEVRERIGNLISAKEAELENIRRHLSEAESARREAVEAMKQATESTDVEAYGKAKAAKITAENTIEMYTTRMNQLSAKEFVTEEESDRVIDSLIEYQNKRTEAFVEAARGPIEELTRILAEYRSDYEEASQTVHTWTSSIHANYRTPRTQHPDGSRRSKTPAPVAGALGFFPQFSETAIRIEAFLKQIK